MKKVIIFVMVLFCGSVSINAQQFSHTSTEKIKKVGYVTNATVDYSANDYEITKKVLGDLTGYNRWALKGLDGKDPESKEFIGILNALNYNPKTNVTDMIYSVNLPRPFGSRNKSILMETFYYYSDNRAIVEFEIKEKNAAIKKALIRFTIIKKDSETAQLKVYAAVILRWYFDIFLSEKKYKEAIEFKILRIASNLLVYGRKTALATPSAVDKSPDL